MSSHTLPPPNLSGPLSKRAVQILRELQGLRVLDNIIPTLSDEIKNSLNAAANQPPQGVSRIEPTLGDTLAGVSSANSARRGGGSRQPVKRFSRAEYLAQTRTSLLGPLVAHVAALVLVCTACLYSGLYFFAPEASELKRQYEVIPTLPSDMKSVTEQLATQSRRHDELSAQHDKLIAYFPNAEQAYGSFSGFLSLLEGQRVWVKSQRGTVSQDPTNPLIAEAKSAKDQGKQADPKAAKSAPGLGTLRGEMKPGMNYYHLQFTLEGSYVGYLAARQALVNENPNLVVHSESVITPREGDPSLQITAFISIPFVVSP